MAHAHVDRLLEEVKRLYPAYVTNPLDTQWNRGNAAVAVIDPDGGVYGHIFGSEKSVGHQCLTIATRKVLQVWRTAFATGRFEERVYRKELDESAFGLQRPDLIGWEGGVPLLATDGRLIAASFSGFRGETDVEILEKAAAAVGLRVKRD